MRHPASQDEVAHVDGDRQGAHGFGDGAGEAVSHRDRGEVTDGGSGEEGFGGESARGDGPGLGQCRAGGERFQASTLTTAAEQTGGVDRQVADLARRSPEAAPQPTAEHQAGRESCPEAEEREVGGFAVAVLVEERRGAEGRCVDIVLDGDRVTQRFGDTLSQGQVLVLQGEVDRVPHRPGAGVHEAGDADAEGPERGKRYAGLRDQLLGDPHRGRHHSVCSGQCRFLYARHDLAVGVEQDAEGLGAADVEAEGIGR